MSEADVEALRPVYERWGRGDWSTGEEPVFAPDYEWGWADEMPSNLPGPAPDPDHRAGQPSARLKEWLREWDAWRCAAEEYLTAGDTVVVLTRYSGRAKGSGVPIDVEGAHVWRMRDGKAVRLEVFSSRRRALEAAGFA